MKKLILTSLIAGLMTSSLYANENRSENRSADIAEKLNSKKVNIMKRLSEREKNIAQAKSCVSAASTFKELKECRQKKQKRGK